MITSIKLQNIIKLDQTVIYLRNVGLTILNIDFGTWINTHLFIKKYFKPIKKAFNFKKIFLNEKNTQMKIIIILKL